jgi:hypothetical protein
MVHRHRRLVEGTVQVLELRVQRRIGSSRRLRIVLKMEFRSFDSKNVSSEFLKVTTSNVGRATTMPTHERCLGSGCG